MSGKRIINLDGGDYIRSINTQGGDYIQGEKKSKKVITVDVNSEEVTEEETADGSEKIKKSKPRNYVENLGGKKIDKFMD